jgi:hypothetical protein
MKGYRKPFLEVKELSQGVPELRGKNRTTVGDNRVRNSMEADNMIQKHLSEFGAMVVFMQGMRWNIFVSC